MLHHPLCVTFPFFDVGAGAHSSSNPAAGSGGDAVIAVIDATLLEAQLSTSSFSITVNRHGEVCQIAKLGGATVDALTLLNCTNVALVTDQELTKFIAGKMEEDAKMKDVGGCQHQGGSEASVV